MASQTSEEILNQIYENDKKSFDDFVNSKTQTINFESLRRLVLSELVLKQSVRPTRICGFTRKQILNMCQYPENYGKQILRLMEFMYIKSGYVKRLIDYFSNMAKANFYVDTEFLNNNAFSVNPVLIRKNFLKYSAESSKFNMRNIINEISHRMYLNDFVFAYVEETDLDISYYFLDPKCCEIRRLVNGNVFGFSINRSLISNSYFEELPQGLQDLITVSEESDRNNLVDVPIENSLCLKYNDGFLYPYPPFFPIIADVLLIDEYKDLAKTKAINDAYKLLVLKVPTKDGQLTMNDKLLSPFIQTALQVVQENIGVLPYPDDVESVEFSTTNSDDRDKVLDATTWAFSEAGVSESLLSGATSGSELKQSIVNDSGDIFRIYRKIENWMDVQMKLRKFVYRSYRFVYRLLDITTFNSQEVIDSELKLAQASIPNKQRVGAALGMSPGAMLGNIVMEQSIFADVFGMMSPLKSSYTESSTSEDVGRPTSADEDLSASGEATRNDDGANDPDNRNQ